MPRRKQTNHHEEIAATLRAARLFVGDSEPESEEEAAVIEETRRELPRADMARLVAHARKLARRE
jgi:hypothetical protein